MIEHIHRWFGLVSPQKSSYIPGLVLSLFFRRDPGSHSAISYVLSYFPRHPIVYFTVFLELVVLVGEKATPAFELYRFYVFIHATWWSLGRIFFLDFKWARIPFPGNLSILTCLYYSMVAHLWKKFTYVYVKNAKFISDLHSLSSQLSWFSVLISCISKIWENI